MPLKLEIKRTLNARSDRVKCVDLHPTEPWMMASLYNGNVHIWNLDSQQLIKTFEVCDIPVRTTKFIARKNWIVTGSDDMQIRVFNYNTLERIHNFEGHSDYIRCIVVHPTSSFILTCGDDMTIKLWDWDQKWACKQIFEGHSHYVMQLVINPKDNNTFASASLDKTIKVWNLGSGVANFTMEGHDKGVNCLDYYCGGDKPYLVSGADDKLVKVWDYQTKTCVQTLEGHAQNISAVSFHTELPIIITGSEDGTIRVWHANTYRLETTLNYGLERVWSLACLKRSNSIAIGYDEGSIVVKLGREEPAMSMDVNGKMIFARHADLQQANIKALGSEIGDIQDGERVPINAKELGSCEIYPQTIAHNANGRFVVVCGDGEYIVYTSMALRNKSFGQAIDFVWSTYDANMYAKRDSSSIKIYKNFKEEKSIKADFGIDTMFGGWLLAVKTISGLSFYDWSTAKLIRKIEVVPKAVYWNDSGNLVSIVTDEVFYVLRYNPHVVEENTDNSDEDGIEAAFDVVWNGEINESVKHGAWVGDCFLYTNANNRLQYCVGGEIVTVAHLERPMYLLGYLSKENRVFLADRSLQVVSYVLMLSVLEYQTLVMRGELQEADNILPTISKEYRGRVARFLEKQGFQEKALQVTTDQEHKFELALNLGKLQLAYDIVSEDIDNSTERKWKQIADASTKCCNFQLAQECAVRAKDYASLLLMATSSGNRSMMQTLTNKSEEDGLNNICFVSKFVLRDLDGCLQLLLDSKRYSEAAFFARTYLPSRIPEIVELWRQTVAAKGYKKIAESLANPDEYPNLFNRYEEMKQAEDYLCKLNAHTNRLPASQYPNIPHVWNFNTIEEMNNNSNLISTTIPIDVNASSPLVNNDIKPQVTPSPLSAHASEFVPNNNILSTTNDIADSSSNEAIEKEIEDELHKQNPTVWDEEEDEELDDDDDEPFNQDNSSALNSDDSSPSRSKKD